MQQLTLDELERTVPARVINVHRSGLIVSDGAVEHSVTLGGSWYRRTSEARPTVGDWVLLSKSGDRIERVLTRKSVFQRVVPGHKVDVQLIAANIDTLFVVSSCNAEFNESRLERYLALAVEAGVEPVVVLTKADLTEAGEAYRARVRAVRGDLAVELVNALDSESLNGVRAWIQPGQTVALVGSSGVGKSTLLNTLAGASLQVTKAIREDGGHGRHTTTARSLHVLNEGGILLDVPGMRELAVADIQPALAEMFEDIEALSRRCRFADCSHASEPGCAIREAIDAGHMDARRLSNYFKLLREQEDNAATLAAQRHRNRQWGKNIRNMHRDRDRLLKPRD